MEQDLEQLRATTRTLAQRFKEAGKAERDAREALYTHLEHCFQLGQEMKTSWLTEDTGYSREWIRQLRDAMLKSRRNGAAALAPPEG